MIGNAHQYKLRVIYVYKTHDRKIDKKCAHIQQDSKHQQFDLNCIKNQSSSYI